MGSKIEMFWLVWLKLSTQRSLLVRLWEMGAPSQGSGGAAKGLKSKVKSRQKTKFCMFNFQGVCKYSADDCIYAHSLEEMRGNYADGGRSQKAQSAASAEVPQVLVTAAATDVQACLPGMLPPPGLATAPTRAPPSVEFAPASYPPAAVHIPLPAVERPQAPQQLQLAHANQQGFTGDERPSPLEVGQLYQAVAGLRMECIAVADLLQAIEVAKADLQQMVSQAGSRAVHSTALHSLADSEQAGVWPVCFRRNVPQRAMAMSSSAKVPSASWSDGVQLP
eukprot:s4267_g4.t1